MKAILLPLYFVKERNEEFDTQLKLLKEQLKEVALFLESQPVGSELVEADAVIFPQLVGEAYKVIKDLKKISVPILAVTSEFGTVAMWDWEIVTYLKANGLKAFAPYNLEVTKMLCKTLGAKKELNGSKFLVFQDNPGDGMQASIFKRFYWWEDECTKRMLDKFGIEIVKKSFKDLGEKAKKMNASDAAREIVRWDIPSEGLSHAGLLSAMQMYLAVKEEVEAEGNVIGAGINCLNESFYSDTTPCLTWNLLFEEKNLLWACEGDTMSLLTKYIVHKTTGASVMMTNLYPFLMGMAALKHERISAFPVVEEPENHVLVAHCGFFGLIPKCFSCKWNLTEKVLGIVDANASAIDGRMKEGNVTLTQLHPTLEKMLVIEGELTGYAQYPDSDCHTGGIIKVKDGYEMMSRLYSHHSILSEGHILKDLKLVADILDIQVEVV